MTKPRGGGGERKRRPLSHTRALRVLKEVAEALNSATTEQQAAGEALRRMADLLGLETGWVWLRDPPPTVSTTLPPRAFLRTSRSRYA